LTTFFFSDLTTYTQWLRYLQDLFTPALTELGWNNTGGPTTQNTRSILTYAGVKYNVSITIDAALALFYTYYNNPNNNTIDPGLRPTVYDSGVRVLGEVAFDFLFQQYLYQFHNGSDVNEMYNNLNACSEGASDPALLQKLLYNYSLDPTKIRVEDTPWVFERVAKNPVGRQIAWNFLKENWDIFAARYIVPNNNVMEVIFQALSSFSTQEQYNEVVAFFQDKDLGTAAPYYQAMLTTMSENIQWMNYHYISSIQWLVARPMNL